MATNLWFTQEINSFSRSNQGLKGFIPGCLLYTWGLLRPQGVWNTTRGKSPYPLDWTWKTNIISLLIFYSILSNVCNFYFYSILSWSFFYSEECPAGTFGINCTEKCKHPTFGVLCSETCDCPVCHHIVGCMSTPENIGKL